MRRARKRRGRVLIYGHRWAIVERQGRITNVGFGGNGWRRFGVFRRRLPEYDYGYDRWEAAPHFAGRLQPGELSRLTAAVDQGLRNIDRVFPPKEKPSWEQKPVAGKPSETGS